jgi:hypothetical protein
MKKVVVFAAVLGFIALRSVKAVDPILLWHFDETSGMIAHDSAGTYDSPVYGGATWTQGIKGNALSFDGIDDYVRGPALFLNSFSVAFWVNTTMAPLSSTQWWHGNSLVDAETPEYVNDWGTSLIDNGKVAFGIGDYAPQPTVTIKSTTLVNDGKWHFVVGTRNQPTGQMLLYIDGRLEAQGIGGTNTLDSIRFIGVGNSSTEVAANAQWFKGIIDEVAIYGSVLGNDQVNELYQSYFNHPPVAVAGCDQKLYAGFDNTATVNLDGSGSSDPDKDALTYTWSYAVNGEQLSVSGVKPALTLPPGVYTFSLVVNDGEFNSEPNETTVEIIAPVKVDLQLSTVLQWRASKMLMAHLNFSTGIDEQIDPYSIAFAADPNIKADYFDMRVYHGNIVNCVAGFGSVPKNVVPGSKVKIFGVFRSGRFFYGEDVLKIIQPAAKK